MNNILQYLVNLSIFIPVIIILIVFSIKLSKINLENIGIYKYIQVIDKISLDNNTNVYVLKIGDEGCVIISSSSSIEKIRDLGKEEIQQIEEKRNNIRNLKTSKLKINNLKLDKVKDLKLDKLNIKEKKNERT